ncbi:MAG: hypothetical protein SWH54_16470 [Thermodesulfobacteriota bacterium]|nr:hypothetical protein [Thermodesulfobacteriota bacterium]
MSNETLEFLKWFIGLPGAIVATVTLPFVIRKYHLECKKILYEIRKLQVEVGEAKPTTRKSPGPFFIWFAHYWVIPCYGSMGILVIVGALTKSMILILSAFMISLVLFVSGSAVSERYSDILSSEKSRSNIKNSDKKGT